MHDYHTLCENFLQQKRASGYKYNTDAIVINEIEKFLIDNNIENITKEIIEQYARINPNRESNTIARNMGVFREFCKYLKTQDIECYQIPDKLYPQHHNYKAHIFSKEEIQNIIENSYIVSKSGHYSYKREQTIPLIFKTLYQTGARISEILNLKVEDYIVDEGCFYLKDTKNNQERLIYLSDSLNEEILKYYQKFHYSKEEYFFQLIKGKVGISTMERNFYKILKLSGITRTEKGPRIHDLRHTFIVHTFEKLIKENKDINAFLPILQVHLGHNSLKSLEYYYQTTKVIYDTYNKLSEEKFGYLIPKYGDDFNE